MTIAMMKSRRRVIDRMISSTSTNGLFLQGKGNQIRESDIRYLQLFIIIVSNNWGEPERAPH